MKSAERTEVTWWVRGSTAPLTLGTQVDHFDWVCLEGDERDREAPHPVFMALAKDDRGGLVCQALVIGDLTPWGERLRPKPIDAAALRSVRIPDLIRMAVRTGDVPDEFGAAVREFLANAPSAGRRQRPGRAGYDDEHFEQVAEVYKAALMASPSSPTKWTAEQLHASLPTVRRWLNGARARGFLPEVEAEGESS